MTDQTTAAPARRLELTLRAVVLGCLLAVIFTAANTYLGLQVGLTFASAIPAAVISMTLLRALKNSTIWENMTVQTVASVGGAMSAIIFVLPGLVMVGWWLEFPFWESVLICVLGGILGVTFSIPLRRALVVNGGLPYPEGVAAAEVLKVGSPGDDQSEEAVREKKRFARTRPVFGSWSGGPSSQPPMRSACLPAPLQVKPHVSSACRRRWAAGPPVSAWACSSPCWGPVT